MGQISQTEFKHFSDKTYFIISKYLLLKLILFKEILVLISNIFHKSHLAGTGSIHMMETVFLYGEYCTH